MTNAMTNAEVVLSAIYTRRAVRVYTPEAVSLQAVERLIGAAVQAPSSLDREPWAFVVIDGAARLRHYSDLAKPHFTPPAGVNPEHLRSTVGNPDYNVFHNALTLIVICAIDSDPQSVEDCSLVAENLMLAAHATGLATCPIGFARPWLRLAETKALLGIDPAYVPAFPLVVGHPVAQPPATRRKTPVVLYRSVS